MAGKVWPGRLLVRAATAPDLPVLVELERAAAAVDHFTSKTTVEDLQYRLDHPGVLGRAVLHLAELHGEPVGWHGLGCFQQPDGLEVLTHRGFVHPDYRGQDVGKLLLAQAEQTLRSVAVSSGSPTSFSAWYYDTELAAARLLQQAGYSAHCRMLEMTCRPRLNTSSVDLPDGLELGPVVDDHLATIWSALIEAMADGAVSVADSPGAYLAWRNLPRWDRQLWTVAWDGDEVAGLCLPYLESGQPERWYIETLAVRRPWRRRGLGKALLARCLHNASQAGADSVRLDVHAEHPQRADQLYASLGFQQKGGLTIVRRPLTP